MIYGGAFPGSLVTGSEGGRPLLVNDIRQGGYREMNVTGIRHIYAVPVLLIALFLGAGISLSADQSAFKDSALSWQKQAKDTRVVVVGVADELGKTGDKGNADVKGLIQDAVAWLGEGDKNLAAGDEAMTKENYEKATNEYNMAWQYYVKAATAGLNAKSILAGL